MRKSALFVTVLALVLPATALAVPAERGDGTLAVKSATGRVVVKATGAVLGRIDDGTIAVTDLSPLASDEIVVLGADSRPAVKPNGTTIYKGTGMRFRVVGGRYMLDVIGSGISLSAVGKGQLSILGTDGVYSVNGTPFKTLPLLVTGFSFGS